MVQKATKNLFLLQCSPELLSSTSEVFFKDSKAEPTVFNCSWELLPCCQQGCAPVSLPGATRDSAASPEQQSHPHEPPTHTGGHSPVHDVKGFIELVFDGGMCQHLVGEHGLPAQVPLGDLFIVGAVTEPRAEHLQNKGQVKGSTGMLVLERPLCHRIPESFNMETTPRVSSPMCDQSLPY